MAESEVPVVMGHDDHPVPKPSNEALHCEGEPPPPFRHPLGEGPTVSSVDAFHAQGPRRKPPEEPGLGGVGVDEVGAEALEKGPDLQKGGEVPVGAYGLDQSP